MTTSTAIELAGNKGIAFSKGRDFKGYEMWTKKDGVVALTSFHGTWGMFTKYLKEIQ
jgi:hypothetical protein